MSRQQVRYGVRAEYLVALNSLLKSGLVELWLPQGLEAEGAGLEAKPHFTLQLEPAGG